MRPITFIIFSAVFSLAQAKPAVVRRFANGTISALPTRLSTEYSGIATIPSVQPSNSTSVISTITSSDVVEITTTVVDTTTLTYTLGPQGSSSVVTTIIENTSTITMTTTIYVTTRKPNGPTGGRSGFDAEESSEPTVTVTDYSATTKTITLQHVVTSTSEETLAHNGAGKFTGSNAGAFFASNNANTQSGSSLVPTTPAGYEDRACGVTTVTATIIEQSTVTVTPSSTDDYAIVPTASPPYGYGNGTNSTSGYPTASHGRLTYHTHSSSTII